MRDKYEMSVREPYFSQIEDGAKTSEGRIAKNRLRTIPIGATLNFKQGGDGREIDAIVESLHIYRDFPEMLQNEDLQALLPGCEQIEDGVRLYESLPRFKEQATRFGVITVRFSLKGQHGK